MKVTIAPPSPQLGDYEWLVREDRYWLVHYARILAAEPRLRGRVLDIGCDNGPDVPEFRELMSIPRQLDGVDPLDRVFQNPFCTEKWQGFFEDCPQIPSGAYDMVLAIQVAEHVRRPLPFLQAVSRVLKPGGVFYSITPHGNHPFAWCVRTLDMLHLKQLLNKEDGRIQPIPSYYRMNRRGALARVGAQAGFDTLEIFYHPNLGWNGYIPRPLRFIPRAYDRALATRVNHLSMIMMYKLEKAAAPV